MRTSPQLDAVYDDCLHLLMAAAALSHRATTFDVGAAKTRLDLHMWMIQLRCQENELILRLCRFDDEHRTQTHLRSAFSSVKNLMTEAERLEVIKALKQFRKDINPLKTQSRNKFVAHLDSETTQPHDPGSTTIIRLCRPVVHIIDLIKGTRQGYNLRSGTYERLDLREYCLIDGS